MNDRYNVKNVSGRVRKAISKYCREKGITQAHFLENDRRLKGYLD